MSLWLIFMHKYLNEKRAPSHHSTWGIPRELHPDNCTQFSSIDFADFCKNWGIQHITSSPHYPQSNGAVEWAVKTASISCTSLTLSWLS